jgi:hypothetical protein
MGVGVGAAAEAAIVRLNPVNYPEGLTAVAKLS